jgi:hypothetical protein
MRRLSISTNQPWLASELRSGFHTKKLAIYVDERILSLMLKDIQTASSFQDMLDAHSVTIPKDDNS